MWGPRTLNADDDDDDIVDSGVNFSDHWPVLFSSQPLIILMAPFHLQIITRNIHG